MTTELRYPLRKSLTWCLVHQILIEAGSAGHSAGCLGQTDEQDMVPALVSGYSMGEAGHTSRHFQRKVVNAKLRGE